MRERGREGGREREGGGRGRGRGRAAPTTPGHRRRWLDCCACDHAHALLPIAIGRFLPIGPTPPSDSESPALPSVGRGRARAGPGPTSRSAGAANQRGLPARRVECRGCGAAPPQQRTPQQRTPQERTPQWRLVFSGSRGTPIRAEAGWPGSARAESRGPEGRPRPRRWLGPGRIGRRWATCPPTRGLGGSWRAEPVRRRA